jgi:hypothetical protein
MEFYPLIFIINKRNYYCIWYSGDKDGFFAENNKLMVFDTEEMLFDYAKKKNIQFVEHKLTSFSIDFAVSWLTRKTPIINSNYFLNFWNHLSDLANSVGEKFYGDVREELINKVYDKLIFSNNLPAVTPQGKKYKPTWSKEERKVIVEIAKDGIRIINSYIKNNN